MHRMSLIGAIVALSSVLVATSSRADVGSVFTYQGRLDQGGTPVQGTADLQFRLYDAAVRGNQVGATMVLNGTAIDEGLFTVSLDFGVAAFNGQKRWLEVTVDGVTLAPRQAVTPVPYAMQTRGLFVDGNGQVGVGTTTPAVRLDVQGTTRAGALELGAAVVRLHPGPQSQLISGWDPNVNAGVSSAFLETTATSGSPGGLYVDGNVAAIWNNGQDLLRLYNSTTLPSGAPRFVVDGTGRVGIGNAAPSWAVDATATQAVARLVSTNANFGSVILLRNNTSQPTGIGGINFENSAGLAVGQIFYVDNGLGTANDFLRFTVGQVQVAEMGPSAMVVFKTTAIAETNFNPLSLTRWASDGLLVNFFRDQVSVGSISVQGGVVSYNAFTGSHHAWTDQALQRGELVRLTGHNRRAQEGDGDGGEVIYGVERTIEPNDRACLGAYLGLSESTRAAGEDNPHLVMAEGNGELWVIDTGRDIEPGDALISSHVPGCAMLDDAERFPIGHVVARAAERVQWSAVRAERGVRKARISVLFNPALRDSRGSDAEELVEAAEAQMAAGLDLRIDDRVEGKIDSRIASLLGQLQTLQRENQELAKSLSELAESVRRQGEELESLKAAKSRTASALPADQTRGSR